MVAYILWFILGLLVLLGIIAVIVVKKTGGHKPDYYAFFIMGCIWLPFGLFMISRGPEFSLGSFFLILGLAYIIIGLVHKKEWKKNHIPFNKLPKGRKRTRIIIMIILGLLVLAEFVAFYLIEKGII